jgi:septal ring factor EnvC (AmiA/AmiB activator)
MRPAGLALVWALCLPAFLPAEATRSEVKSQIKDAKQDLKQIKTRLQAKQKDLTKKTREEKSLMSRLEELNRSLEGKRRAAKTHVRNLGLVEDRLTRIENRLGELGKEEAAVRASLRRSLTALYKTRGRRGPALLFGSRTPAEFATRVRYLAELSAATGRGVRTLRQSIGQVKGYREEYSQRQAELLRERSEVETQRREVERERLKRLSLLKSVRTQKALAANAVQELQRASGRLQGLLSNLQAEVDRLARSRSAQAPSALGGPTTLRRGLAWPLRGRLISRYGRQRHPVFHTPVFNRGIEIAAPHGSPVHAVASGTVLFADHMDGFGELAVLDHGGGMMSVYGYNSELHVKPGQGVAQGDLIADVGEAGASDQPSLYFEIRKGAKALNPFTYLRSR